MSRCSIIGSEKETYQIIVIKIAFIKITKIIDSQNLSFWPDLFSEFEDFLNIRKKITSLP